MYPIPNAAPMTTTADPWWSLWAVAMTLREPLAGSARDPEALGVACALADLAHRLADDVLTLHGPPEAGERGRDARHAWGLAGGVAMLAQTAGVDPDAHASACILVELLASIADRWAADETAADLGELVPTVERSRGASLDA